MFHTNFIFGNDLHESMAWANGVQQEFDDRP
jgi:hypothetical protein